MMNLEIRCEFLESPVTENMLLPAPPLDDRFEDDAAVELSEVEEDTAPEVSLGSSARVACVRKLLFPLAYPGSLEPAAVVVGRYGVDEWGGDGGEDDDDD